jgi:hypothetical protein
MASNGGGRDKHQQKKGSINKIDMIELVILNTERQEGKIQNRREGGSGMSLRAE